MVRGGKASCKRKFNKTKVRTKDRGSDDSDEDYVVSDEENEVSDDWDEDYCSSLDGCASEESFHNVVEDDEVKEVKKVRKAGGSKARKSFDSFIVDEEEEEEEEMERVKKTVRSKVSRGFSGQQKNGVKQLEKRKRLVYKEEEEDDTDDDDDDDYYYDDEEFTPDEEDWSGEEEVRVKKKKNNVKVGKRGYRKNGRVRGRKRRKSLVSKKPLRKKGRKTSGTRRRVRFEDECNFIDSSPDVRENNGTKRGRKKRRYVAPSDSDFVSSGSSDFEYTISEEEREQVREAKELCGNSRTSMRNSSVSNDKFLEVEDGVLQQQKKPPARKGKEKIVEEVKTEVGKQVCGICLSEEDKRRVKGTLNCCTHYFCFTCIMEWAKVESRCPLCKQRFKTISKPARCAMGIDLREVVIPVPERDQVYQPSEEELRSYLDPYENVICTECHEGGDDGLMLLCDLCDSPAHTYCVGLGREVPVDNWYCEVCRPVALGSSSSFAQARLSDQRTADSNLSRASPVTNYMVEGLDLNSVSSPRTSFTQGFADLPSPRFPAGDFQASYPVAGPGAPTLSGRRMIHRHIQQLLSVNRMHHMAGRTEGNSAVNLSSELLNSQIDQVRETIVQCTSTLEREASYHTFFEERLQDNPSPQVQDNNFFSPRLNQLRGQAVQDSTPASANRPLNGTLWPGLAGMSSLSGHEQLHQWSNRPNANRQDSDFQIAKEQLQSVVKSHLKNLSRDNQLGQSTFKDIARSSSHTILAACGLEHKSSEVVPVPQPSICSHIELSTGGMTSLMRGCCSSCFDSFIGDVVKRILDAKLSQQWLSLGL
ncbi:hypothetical protein FEM48_Zijuj02G0134200 [Ziziphus jujuba var. spinosa]|uniref:PHD and RING finger domain-containing protein 1 n=1 Tax=Ziziphus jujuba var. spinosa TaxID=714518 RepID=A0A978VVZ3_ZIZJJ|nr:hypothetical protein FEM48_Zijuj02G0134200 [Ziziphus jujuba var. spinosa]